MGPMSGHDSESDGPRRRGPGRPRQADVEPRVLRAALEVLAERGFGGMTIAEVAVRSGVGKPTVYRRWPSKPILATAAIEYLVAQERVARTGDLVADVTAQVRTAYDNLAAARSVPLLGVLLAEADRHPELIEAYRNRLVHPRLAALRSLLTDAAGRGELRADADFDAASVALIGTVVAGEFAGRAVGADWPRSAVAVIIDGLRVEHI